MLNLLMKVLLYSFGSVFTFIALFQSDCFGGLEYSILSVCLILFSIIFTICEKISSKASDIFLTFLVATLLIILVKKSMNTQYFFLLFFCFFELCTLKLIRVQKQKEKLDIKQKNALSQKIKTTVSIVLWKILIFMSICLLCFIFLGFLGFMNPKKVEIWPLSCTLFLVGCIFFAPHKWKNLFWVGLAIFAIFMIMQHYFHLFY